MLDASIGVINSHERTGEDMRHSEAPLQRQVALLPARSAAIPRKMTSSELMSAMHEIECSPYCHGPPSMKHERRKPSKPEFMSSLSLCKISGTQARLWAVDIHFTFHCTIIRIANALVSGWRHLRSCVQIRSKLYQASLLLPCWGIRHVVR